MVSIVSHEIKNPLMIIRASAERLRKRENSIESNFIVEETDRLNGIVSGYLKFAQSGRSDGATLITSGSSEVINISDMITNIKKHLQENFPNDILNWIESEIPQDISFTTDKGALRQVLLNLIINSVEACKSAGKEIKIGLEADQNNDKIMIRIIDYGPGIPKAVLKHIFEPFNSTKTSGTGLGLYLCKKIIEEMNGKIIIKSRPGEKTVAAITLPKQPIE